MTIALTVMMMMLLKISWTLLRLVTSGILSQLPSIFQQSGKLSSHGGLGGGGRSNMGGPQNVSLSQSNSKKRTSNSISLSRNSSIVETVSCPESSWTLTENGPVVRAGTGWTAPPNQLVSTDQTSPTLQQNRDEGTIELLEQISLFKFKKEAITNITNNIIVICIALLNQ